MLRIFIVLTSVFFIYVACERSWSTSGRIHDYEGFFIKAMQEMIYEVEKRGWSQLKLTDYVIPLNERLYNWLVVGNATYTNGFLISIQKIDLTNISPRIGNTMINDEQVVVASVVGMLNLRDVKVGFDVEADLGDEKPHRFTGTFNHVLVQLRITISKNLSTNEITADSSLNSLSAGSGVRMVYMPSGNITEVLSRTYVPSRNWDGAVNWGRNTFAPTLVQVVQERIPFPNVCFSQC